MIEEIKQSIKEKKVQLNILKGQRKNLWKNLNQINQKITVLEGKIHFLADLPAKLEVSN